jgi:hypothetical protein
VDQQQFFVTRKARKEHKTNLIGKPTTIALQGAFSVQVANLLVRIHTSGGMHIGPSKQEWVLDFSGQFVECDGGSMVENANLMSTGPM